MQTNTESQNRAFNYHPTTPEPFYSIALGIDADDVRDCLDARLGQLYAMLMMTRGDGGESFRAYNDEIQDNYMQSCTALAEECRALFEQFPHMGRNNKARAGESLLANVLERLHALCENGALIINPRASKSQSDDAQGFLDWAGRQVKGGDQ